MQTLQYNELLSLFDGTDYNRMAAYIAACPPSPQQPLASQSIALKHPHSALLALYGLISDYAHQGYYNYAQLLGQVQYDLLLARLLQSKPAYEADLLDYLSSAIQHVAKAYFDKGDHEGLLQYTDSVEQEIKQAGLHQVLPPMLLYKAEGLLSLGRIDEASRVFEPLRNYTDFLPVQKNKQDQVGQPILIQRDTIGRRLDQLVIDATKISNAQSGNPNNGLSNAIREGLKVFNNIQPKNEITIPVDKVVEALNEIQNFELGNTTDPTAFLKQNIPGMDRFEGLARSVITSPDESRLFDMQRFVERSGQLLVRPETAHNPDALRANLPELLNWQPYARQTRPDDYHSLLWMSGVSYYRLNDYPSAIEQFEQLWDSQETRRLGIVDYNKRAGILSQFPYLFALLCNCYYQTGNAPALLRAMEASKGRVIADWLDKRTGLLTSSLKLGQLADTVPEAMRQHQAHYLSFFVDDDWTFAVLVSKAGEYFIQQVPIGKSILDQWINEGRTNPNGWKGNLFKKQVANLSELLAPLVNWLEPLLAAGVMQTNDHICYCPDGDLHLFPLTYIRFQNDYLIDTFSLSRTQGVASILAMLAKPIQPIDQFLVVQATVVQDDRNQEKKAAFGEVGNWLTTQLVGQILIDEQTELDQLTNQPASERLIHFATHGFFPDKTIGEEGGSPYLDSGLLLFANEQRPVNLPEDTPGSTKPRGGEVNKNPEEAKNWQKRKPFLLSPDRLLRAGWNIDGSHVTLQGCVSGQAKEGIGGDALGLDWALLQSGASSLLSTGWNVDIYWANDFCLLFYQAWLQGYSKAEAYRQACLALKAKRKAEIASDDLISPYYWVSFSLTGDWR